MTGFPTASLGEVAETIDYGVTASGSELAEASAAAWN